MQSISELVERALAQIRAAATPGELDRARVQYLGKSGELTSQMKSLGSLPAEERKAFGQSVNTAKAKLEDAIEQRRTEQEQSVKPAGPALDVTLPGRRR